MGTRAFYSCPHCKGHICMEPFGTRSTGPAQVTCRHCGKVVDTGWRPWSSLSKGQKVSETIGTLLLSLVGGIGFGVIFALLVGIACAGVTGSADPPTPGVAVIGGLLFMVLFVGYRLYKLWYDKL